MFDIASYGRGSAGEASGRLTPEKLEQIRRTVQRVPEVVVKVLARGSSDLKAAGQHLDYIGRYGHLELNDEDGERIRGRIGKELLEEWDLDIDDVRRQATLASANGRKPPKLIHKLMFSMPPGTPPAKVLAAVGNFAREEFWGQHRYAFVLHTDEIHPHVHLVLKAVNEQGVRLNIRKVELRQWRSKFARHLRLLGIAANATERAVRGQSQKAKSDGIFRASLRGESTYMRMRAESVAAQLIRRQTLVEPGKRRLAETRRQIELGWHKVSELLNRQGMMSLASQVQEFVGAMPPVKTESEWIAAALLTSTRLPKIERSPTQ